MSTDNHRILSQPNTNTDPDYHSDQEQTPATHNRGVCSPVTTPCYNKGASHKNIPNETDPNIKSDQKHKPTTHNKGICSPVSILQHNEGTSQILKQKNIKVNIGLRLPKFDTSNTLNNYPKSNKKMQVPIYKSKLNESHITTIKSQTESIFENFDNLNHPDNHTKNTRTELIKQINK